MSLPHSHFESLQSHLRIHEERLTLLHRHLNNLLGEEMWHVEVPVEADSKEHSSEVRQKTSKAARDPNPKVRSLKWIASHREVIEREIRIHDQLIELGQDPKVFDALRELAEDRHYALEAARDPKSAAHLRGIEIPANMVLRIDLELDRVLLQIIFYEDLCPFVLTWSSDSGFLPPKET